MEGFGNLVWPQNFQIGSWRSRVKLFRISGEDEQWRRWRPSDGMLKLVGGVWSRDRCKANGGGRFKFCVCLGAESVAEYWCLCEIS